MSHFWTRYKKMATIATCYVRAYEGAKFARPRVRYRSIVSYAHVAVTDLLDPLDNGEYPECRALDIINRNQRGNRRGNVRARGKEEKRRTKTEEEKEARERARKISENKIGEERERETRS